LSFKPVIPVKIEDFLDPIKRKMWVKKKNMKVFSVYNPAKEIEHIDIMVENCIDFDEAYNRRENIKVEGVVLPVVSVDDLIKIKKIANRKRDKIDIEALKEIKKMRK